MKTSATARKPKFVDGGTVQAKSGIYVKRPADDELLELCRQGEFAYVLTSRQMGKSSLMVNTMHELAREGVQSVSIDLSGKGTDLTAEQWYRNFLFDITDQLELDINCSDWWDTQADLGHAQRLLLFLREVVLKKIPAPTHLVIFVDEIDSTLSFRNNTTGTSFTDDFFAAIRSFYNDRSLRVDVERLSFVLIGVATPTDLIQDAKRTPFNIGQLVELDDLTLNQAHPLAAGFDLPTDEAEQVLQWVFHWTGGHPYLTQRLCKELVARQIGGITRQAVDDVAGEVFLGEKGGTDKNISHVRDMLTRKDRAPNGDRAGVLHTYHQILTNRRPIPDEERSQIKTYLKLSGVVRREGGYLRVRNRIYGHVFNDKWAKEHRNEYAGKKVRQYRRRALIASAAMLAMILLSLFVWGERAKAVTAKTTAERAQAAAVESAREAERQAQLAREAEVIAKREKVNADEARIAAEIAEKKAQASARRAKQQRLIALKAKEEALTSAEKARAAQKDAEDQKIAADNSRDDAIQQRQKADLAKTEADQQKEKAEKATGEAIKNKKNATGASVKSKSQSKAANALQTLRTYPDASLETALGAVSAVPNSEKDLDQISEKQGAETIDPNNLLPLETKEAVRQALLESRRRILIAADKPISGIAYGPRTVLEKDSSGRDIVGRYIATASDDKLLRVWHVELSSNTEKKYTRLVGKLEGHGDAVQSVAFGTDNVTRKIFIVTASWDKQAIVWEFPEAEVNKYVRDVEVEQAKPPIKQFATLSLDGKTGKDEKLQYAAFKPGDRRFIVTASRNGTAVIWEDKSEEGQSNGSLDKINKRYKPVKVLRGHKGVVYSAFYNRTGDRIVTASADKTAKVWDPATGHCLQTLRGHLEPVRQAVFNYDGTKVATASSDNLAIVWNWEAGTREKILRGHSDQIWSIAYNNCETCEPEKRDQLVTSSEDRTARIWDTKTARTIAELRGHTGTIWRAEFAASGDYVITGSEDKTARTWQIVKERSLVSFDFDNLAWAAYSPKKTVAVAGAQTTSASPTPTPERSWVVTTTGRGYPKLWDAETGRPVIEKLGVPDTEEKQSKLLPRLLNRVSNWVKPRPAQVQKTECQFSSEEIGSHPLLAWNDEYLVAILKQDNSNDCSCLSQWRLLAWQNEELEKYLKALKNRENNPSLPQPKLDPFADSSLSKSPSTLLSNVKSVHLSSEGQLSLIYNDGSYSFGALQSGESPLATHYKSSPGTFVVAFSRDGKYFVQQTMDGQYLQRSQVGSELEQNNSKQDKQIEIGSATIEKIKNCVVDQAAKIGGEANCTQVICNDNCSKALILTNQTLREIDFQQTRITDLSKIFEQQKDLEETNPQFLNASYSQNGEYVLVATEFERADSLAINLNKDWRQKYWNVKVLIKEKTSQLPGTNYTLTSILRGHVTPLVLALTDPALNQVLTASDDGLIHIHPKVMFEDFSQVKKDADIEKGRKHVVASSPQKESPDR